MNYYYVIKLRYNLSVAIFSFKSSKDYFKNKIEHFIVNIFLKTIYSLQLKRVDLQLLELHVKLCLDVCKIIKKDSFDHISNYVGSMRITHFSTLAIQLFFLFPGQMNHLTKFKGKTYTYATRLHFQKIEYLNAIDRVSHS